MKKSRRNEEAKKYKNEEAKKSRWIEEMKWEWIKEWRSQEAKNSKNEELQEWRTLTPQQEQLQILHNLQYLPILQTLHNYFQVYIILQGLLNLCKLSIISKPL